MGLGLDDGSSIPCDLMVLCKGVESRTELLEGVVPVDCGFMVNDTQETNIAGVYVAGDPVATYDIARKRGACECHMAELR